MIEKGVIFKNLNMEIVESNLSKRVFFEGVLKNLEFNGFLKTQKSTRATFLKCGTP